MNLKKNVLIGIIAIIIIYATILIISDITTVLDQATQFNFIYLPIILLFIPLSFFVLFVRWNFLLTNSGIKIPFNDNFKILLSGYALGITPGKFGEYIKCQLIKNKFGISRKKTAPIVLAEQFYNLVGIITASLFGILFFEYVIYVIPILIVLVSIIYYSISTEKIFNGVLKKIGKIKFLKNFADQLPESYSVIRKSTRGKALIIVSALSVLFWIIEAVQIYFIMLAFGIDTIGFFTLIPTYTTSIVLGFLSFLPLGIGVVEGTLTGFLTYHGLEFSLATTLVVFIRIFTRWISISIGFVALKLTNAFSVSETD